jgi:deoxyribonuclease V
MTYLVKNVKEARAVQMDMLRKLKFDEEFEFSHIKTIAGIDVSYDKHTNQLFAGVVLFEYPALTTVDEFGIAEEATFPYIPGYLSFREGPAIIHIFEKYALKPDIILVDGHGIAHPRKLGIATFLGIYLNLPSIGIAKKKLIGTYEMPAADKGSYSYLYRDEEVIGIVYRSKSNVKPVFISAGYRIPLEKAFEFVKNLDGKYRLPEPTRKAHIFVNKLRNKISASGTSNV